MLNNRRQEEIVKAWLCATTKCKQQALHVQSTVKTSFHDKIIEL